MLRDSASGFSSTAAYGFRSGDSDGRGGSGTESTSRTSNGFRSGGGGGDGRGGDGIGISSFIGTTVLCGARSMTAREAKMHIFR